MSKKSLALLVALTLSTAAFAQLPDLIRKNQSAPVDAAAAVARLNSGVAPAATSACAYQFTLAATAARPYLQYCVSVNGNIVEFQSPSGVEHISVGTVGDGYAICDVSGSVGVGYHDYADFGDSDTAGGWQAPVLLSQTSTAVKIARTTADGLWTLTQTFTESATDSSVKVAMAVKNNTLISRNIFLTRFTDIDAFFTATNILDGTQNTAFGYDASQVGRGLQISLAVPNSFHHAGFATTQVSNACNMGAAWTGLVNGADGVAYFLHAIPVPAHGTKTVTLKYKGI